MINQSFSNLLVGLVGTSGLEPPTSRLSGARSNHLSYAPLWLLRFILFPHVPLVEMMGIEPMTPCLQGRCSPSWATPPSGLGLFFNVIGHWKLNNKQILVSSAVQYASRRLFLFLVLFCLFANTRYLWAISHILHRKEVIQPHLPIRLPCYDLTPINKPTFDCCPLAVSPQASGVFIFHGLTGGVYKARERIHRGMLIRDY